MAAKQVLYFLYIVCKWVQWTTWDFNIFCNILRRSFNNIFIDDISRLLKSLFDPSGWLIYVNGRVAQIRFGSNYNLNKIIEEAGRIYMRFPSRASSLTLPPGPMPCSYG
jgi:hypothetical protein